MNRKLKRRSKKDEEMRSYLLKREAEEARQQIIQQEIENIEECVTTGFFFKNLLHNLISKVTTPFS